LGWWLYTRTVLPIVGGLVGGRAWFRVGRFLGSSISDYHRRYPPDRLLDVWRRAGIVHIVVRRMSLGGALLISGIKADD
jgi:demethylmenaquinone methyltransferase / 2-methoxy-6-polyprenyl-1,4-benzoquinol methylase